MAITQERILRMLEAAEAYAETYASIVKEARRLIDTSASADALLDLFAFIVASEPAAEAKVTIALERQHYDLTSKKNARAKRAQAKRRARLRQTQDQTQDQAQAELEEQQDEAPDGTSASIDFTSDRSEEPEKEIEL